MAAFSSAFVAIYLPNSTCGAALEVSDAIDNEYQLGFYEVSNSKLFVSKFKTIITISKRLLSFRTALDL